MRKSFVVLGEAQDKNFQSPTEGVLLPMPVFWRHLVGGEEAYLQGWNHERPVAAPAPPTAEGMESLRAVDLGAPTSGARLHLVGDLIRLSRYAHISPLVCFRHGDTGAVRLPPLGKWHGYANRRYREAGFVAFSGYVLPEP